MATGNPRPTSRAGMTLLYDIMAQMDTLIVGRIDTVPQGDSVCWIIRRMVESAQRDCAEAYRRPRHLTLVRNADDA
jgi:hypothetical protein